MARQSVGEPSPDPVPEPAPEVLSEDEPTKELSAPSRRSLRLRAVAPTAHHWPGVADDASPAGASTVPVEFPPDRSPEAEAEPGSEAEAEPEPEAEVEPEPEAEVEPEPEAEVEPGSEAEVGADGQPAAPGRSPVSGAWSTVPRPLRIALGLCLLPLTVYVLTVRSRLSVAVKTGVVAAWTVLLLAPLVLAQGPGRPVHLPVPRAPQTGQGAAPVVSAADPVAQGSTAPPASAPRIRPPSAPPAAAGMSTTPPAAAGMSTAPPASGSATAPPPAPAPTAVAPSPAPVSTCGAPPNPWGYNFCGGNLISSPPQDFCSVFPCVAHFWDQKKPDHVVECSDGTYAEDSRGAGSCLSHNGEMRPLYGP
jgi:hypothetical protein